MNSGAWWATVHGVSKNGTQQSTDARKPVSQADFFLKIKPTNPFSHSSDILQGIFCEAALGPGYQGKQLFC